MLIFVICTPETHPHTLSLFLSLLIWLTTMMLTMTTVRCIDIYRLRSDAVPSAVLFWGHEMRWGSCHFASEVPFRSAIYLPSRPPMAGYAVSVNGSGSAVAP